MSYSLNLLKLFFKYLQFQCIKKELPAKAVMAYGPISNNNGFATEPRLVGEWADYMTFDNSLWGDEGWKASCDYKSPESMVAWLERNTLYTYKRDTLGMTIQVAGRAQVGNPNIDHHKKIFGKLKLNQPNGAWQYKIVKKLPFGYAGLYNMGWLLNDVSQQRAMFMFSARLKKVG